MVAHVLRPAVVRGAAAARARRRPHRPPPHPPRVTARLLLLHHDRLDELPARARPLLAGRRVGHHAADRRAAALRRHEVGDEGPQSGRLTGGGGRGSEVVPVRPRLDAGRRRYERRLRDGRRVVSRGAVLAVEIWGGGERGGRGGGDHGDGAGSHGASRAAVSVKRRPRVVVRSWRSIKSFRQSASRVFGSAAAATVALRLAARRRYRSARALCGRGAAGVAVSSVPLRARLDAGVTTGSSAYLAAISSLGPAVVSPSRSDTSRRTLLMGARFANCVPIGRGSLCGVHLDFDLP